MQVILYSCGHPSNNHLSSKCSDLAILLSSRSCAGMWRERVYLPCVAGEVVRCALAEVSPRKILSAISVATKVSLLCSKSRDFCRKLAAAYG